MLLAELVKCWGHVLSGHMEKITNDRKRLRPRRKREGGESAATTSTKIGPCQETKKSEGPKPSMPDMEHRLHTHRATLGKEVAMNEYPGGIYTTHGQGCGVRLNFSTTLK